MSRKNIVRRKQEVARNKVMNKGMLAFVKGKDLSANPYSLGTVNYKLWKQSFLYAKAKTEEEAAAKAAKTQLESNSAGSNNVDDTVDQQPELSVSGATES